MINITKHRCVNCAFLGSQPPTYKQDRCTLRINKLEDGGELPFCNYDDICSNWRSKYALEKRVTLLEKEIRRLDERLKEEIEERFTMGRKIREEWQARLEHSERSRWWRWW